MGYPQLKQNPAIKAGYIIKIILSLFYEFNNICQGYDSYDLSFPAYYRNGIKMGLLKNVDQLPGVYIFIYGCAFPGHDLVSGRFG